MCVVVEATWLDYDSDAIKYEGNGTPLPSTCLATSISDIVSLTQLFAT